MTPEQESQRILGRLTRPEFTPAMNVLEKQFQVLSNRAQVLLGISGVVISTTGFSGRLIAGTGVVAQLLVIIGVSFVLAAAVTVVVGVMPLKWITMQEGDTPEAWLVAAIGYRNRKQRRYFAGIVLMIVGLGLYVVSIIVMLLYPAEAPGLISVR